MRMTWIAALCLALAVPLAADVRGGNLDEEFRADVAVQTVDANRVLMTIDNRGESRFGVVNCVFAIRSEGAFAAPVSLRLTNARVIVRADHVVAIADDGRAVIFGHDPAAGAAVLLPKSEVTRVTGFELVRYLGEGMLTRAKAQPPRECEAGGAHSAGCGLTGCAKNPNAAGCSASCAAGYDSCCHCDGKAASCGCYKP